MALLEYGMARLAAVATRVGQCAEVLDNGRAGILIPPAAPDKLAEVLVLLLRSPDRRAELGERFYPAGYKKFIAQAQSSGRSAGCTTRL